MLWGFNGQLSPHNYPTGWYAMDTTLNGIAGPKRVLMLPWHQYMQFSFTDRIIANPAKKFFAGTNIIVSDDPEFGNLSPTVPNKNNNAITKALKQPDTLRDTLKKQGINYILLAKESDTSRYAFLNTLSGASIVKENDSFTLYRLGQ